MNTTHSDNLEGNTPRKCPDCGADAIRTRIEVDRFVYGSGEDAVHLDATVPVHKCEACGFEYIGAEAEDAHHAAVCRHKGVMAPDQVVGVWRRHDLNRSEFARVSKLGDATLARWERGALIQNAANDNYLYLLQFADNIHRLQARTRPSTEQIDVPQSLGTTFSQLENLEEIAANANRFKLQLG